MCIFVTTSEHGSVLVGRVQHRPLPFDPSDWIFFSLSLEVFTVFFVCFHPNERSTTTPLSCLCASLVSSLSLTHTYTHTFPIQCLSVRIHTPPFICSHFLLLGHSSVFQFPRETRSTFAVLVHTIRSLASSLFWYIDTQHTRTQVHTQSVVTRSLIVLFGELWKIGFCV